MLPDLSRPAAVCEVALGRGAAEITGLDGYEQAFVVFRFRGAVVGQGWLPVSDGTLPSGSLERVLAGMAWPVWQHLCELKDTPRRRPPSVSVVVCTRERTEDLARCLRSLRQLELKPLEIVVVDRCPSDETTARLVKFYPEVRYVREPRPGAGIARNRGIAAARGEIVAFTDDGAVVDPGWLGALVRGLDDPLTAIVTGITMPVVLETPAQMWLEQTHGFARGFCRRELDQTTISPLAAGQVGASVNMAMRRELVAEIGQLDSGEDHELYYRALSRGHRVAYDPTALVWHRHRESWRELKETLHGYGLSVFAWWTRALLIEREWTLLRFAPEWFVRHHIRQLYCSLTRRPGRVPLSLAWAEFRGALLGPLAYLARRRTDPC